MSRSVPLQLIQRLQNNPTLIRNICILAHVDHGKTTLADSLISSNSIISSRLAGEVRYMDNWEEEQKRGITMKSSSISLFFEDQTTITDEATGEKKQKSIPYLINLVDSPGHIDFSSDVSAAVRLCDGCLVIVDAIEGVCTQTLTVIKQAFQEGVKPILIINKIDRLILHLKQTPLDAYLHIRNIIEKVNAYISSLYTAEVISNTATTSYIIDSAKEEELFVSPANGTVLFASAIDGWCFSLKQFAELYAPILEINKSKLLKILWGDYIYNAKTKKVTTWIKTSSQPPVFVKLVLSTIWKVYKSVYKRNNEAIQSILEITKVKLSERELKTPDDHVLVKLIMSRWLPLYKAVLKSVVKILPSPVAAQHLRYEFIWDSTIQKQIRDKLDLSPLPLEPLIDYKHGFDHCDRAGTLMIYICKLFTIQGCDIQGYPCDMNKDYEIALCRSFSGTITKSTSLFVIPCNSTDMVPVEIKGPIQLFILMGREIVAVDEVPAGNIFGILGLEGAIIKMGTVSDHQDCPSLSSLRLTGDPIVQIAIETEKPNDMPVLIDQLKILNNNDNSIQIKQLKTGEYILSAIGELQLDVIIKDLKKRLSGIELVVSPPIINIREACACLAPLEEGKEPRLPPSAYIQNKLVAKMRVLPLPEDLCTLLYVHKDSLTSIFNTIMNLQEPSGEVKLFCQNLENCFMEAPLLKPYWGHIVAFGPKLIDTNILVYDPSLTKKDSFCTFSKQLELYYQLFIHPNETLDETPNETPNETTLETSSTIKGSELTNLLLTQYNTSIINGFKVATESGPLCGEGMWGVLCILEDLTVMIEDEEDKEKEEKEEKEENKEDMLMMYLQGIHERMILRSEAEELVKSVNSGMIIALTKQLCHLAYMKASARIAEPMYRCILQCNSEHLGKLYSVLNQRRGEVQNEDIWEGTDIFTITCILPVTESLGLATDLRQQTSGAVNQPQLQFSHWQILDEDPFSKPTTEEEIEEWGDSFATRNKAKQIIDSIRKRKGLQTDEKIVENAEKQRTMKSKYSVF